MQHFQNYAAMWTAKARQFDQDQDGMETMQVVMVLALAAIVVLFARNACHAISCLTAGLVYDAVGGAR